MPFPEQGSKGEGALRARVGKVTFLDLGKAELWQNIIVKGSQALETHRPGSNLTPGTCCLRGAGKVSQPL